MHHLIRNLLLDAHKRLLQLLLISESGNRDRRERRPLHIAVQKIRNLIALAHTQLELP